MMIPGSQRTFDISWSRAQQAIFAVAIGFCIGIAGCDRAGPVSFEPNHVARLKHERLELANGEKFPDRYSDQIQVVMAELFGTPDEPRFPEYQGGAVEHGHFLQILTRMAGPVSSDRRGEHVGLYRAHCASCHGITGDGAGPVALALVPYPRDFRLGKFKFKSTPLRRAPTHDDLVRTIRDGIPGTAMPSFHSFPEQDIEELAHYVKYLSIRGEFERRLWASLAELNDDDLIDIAGASDTATDEQRQYFAKELASLTSEYLWADLWPRWRESSQYVTPADSPPDAIDPKHADHHDLVSVGRQLYEGKAACLQCHGGTGRGDGRTDNFDDWTLDWIKAPGVDPMVKSTWQDFKRAGALPPLQIPPRNLQLAAQRGGSTVVDLYRRIANGIEGTPMPSAPALSNEEIWALVAYVQSLSRQPQ